MTGKMREKYLYRNGYEQRKVLVHAVVDTTLPMHRQLQEAGEKIRSECPDTLIQRETKNNNTLVHSYLWDVRLIDNVRRGRYRYLTYECSEETAR